MEDKVTILTTLLSELRLVHQKNLLHLFYKAMSIDKEELIIDRKLQCVVLGRFHNNEPSYAMKQYGSII